MKLSLEIGKVFGIPIRIHFTFFLLLLFVALSSGEDGIGGLWGIVLVCWVFICVILHELGHSLVARRFDIKVDSITLLPIGGVASMRTMPTTPASELAISAAGPAVSIALAGIFAFLANQIYGKEVWLKLEYGFDIPILAQLSVINFVLAIFNLIPAFPMDGGRILRAILWYKMGFLRATSISGRIGKFLAIMLFVFSLFMGRFWLGLIALFIYLGAQTEVRAAYWIERLSGMKARDVLDPEVIFALPEQKIGDVYQLGEHRGQFNFPVADVEDKIVGILSKPELISAVNSGRGSEPVSKFMKKKVFFCLPDDNLGDVVQDIVSNNLPYVLVMKDEDVVGIITPERIWEEVYGRVR